MKKAIKDAWLSGLRSGKFKQHHGSLCSVRTGSNKLYEADAHCCIGVAGVVNNVPAIDYIDTFICAKHLGISRTERHSIDDVLYKMSDYDMLIHMNDTEKKSFEEIANWIEANIPTED